MTPPPVSAIVKQSVRSADETGGGVNPSHLIYIKYSEVVG